jgi:uncharacterized alkaline shock family protein YloU
MTVVISDNALTGIVVRAAEEVDGARVRKRRGVQPKDGRVSLWLAARYGVVLPELARDVQERVATALHEMCELDVSVDVTIEEIEGE